MTRSRMFGSDVPFCDWMRSNPELPSYSASHAIGFVATDVDVLVHRYLTSVDGVGSRQVQSLGQIEVKTHGGDIHKSQRDTLYKSHVFSEGTQTIAGQYCRHWGVACLFMSGTPSRPDETAAGRFETM